MRIITIIGARPQFIKAAIVSYAIRQHNAQSAIQIEERILHTGQHYDYNMSQVFFDQMQIPAPAWHLACNDQTVEQMRDAIAPIIDQQANYILLYGDTNSTLAGALAAEQCNIPIIHVEAGLRSFNAQMAEESNRIETDKRSALLFCPTHTAVANLQREDITEGVYMVGDVMYDASLLFTEQASKTSNILSRLNLTPRLYVLATIHRAETTCDTEKVANILRAFAQIPHPVILPLHPRTRKVIAASKVLTDLAHADNIHIIESVSYVDMQWLEEQALCILTDSGGVQKEAYFHHVPCITMRDETEWVETVETGWNTLAGTNIQKIVCAFHNLSIPSTIINEYGDGKASTKIIEILCQNAC
ncbi:MAG: non-hydrolyzing UDP-N-acetylglucosamine 2-epimerase [Paludibacteraceae bacterium]